MITNKKLSLYQMILLIVACRITTVYTYVPSLATPPANQDVWITEVLSIFIIALICIPILYLINKFETKSFMVIIETLCGKFLGKFIEFLYVLFLMFIGTLLHGHLTQFIGSAIMPETPIYIIILFSSITIIYVSFKGLDTLGMISELLVPIILILIIIFAFLSINKMDFKFIFPILSDSKFYDLAIGTVNNALRFYDIILIAIFVPKFEEKSHINKCFLYSVLIFSIFYLIITLSTQAVLGVEQAKHARFPHFVYTQQINLFNFIQRIESVSVMSWFFTVFIKLTAYIYVAALVMQQIFNTKTYKIFIIPELILAYLIIRYTALSKSVVFSSLVSYKFFPYVSFIVIVIIPIFLLIVYFFRRKKINLYIK